MPRVRRTLVISTTLVLAVLGSGCAPEPVTAQGNEVSGLYDFFFVAAAAVFALVAGLIGWSIVRYRRREGDDDLPPQFHTNLALEIVWFAIPTVIIAVLFVVTAVRLDRVNSEVADPLVVEVEGFQWGWRFSYPEAGVLVEGIPQDPAEIVLPVGEPIAFVLSTRDVNHAFYVPRFLIKRDLIPGQENRVDVTIEEEGTYTGACAEFCGLLHDRMSFTLKAVSADEFESWIDERAAEVADGDG